MSAAFALPGLSILPAQAQTEPELSLQYGHYEEGERELHGQTYSQLNLKPIEADSLAVAIHLALMERVDFGARFTQDTWSGATPVVSLPNAAIVDQLVSGASSPKSYTTDSAHHPINVDWNSFDPKTGKYRYVQDSRLVHLMGSASPEVRKQADFRLGYAWDNATVNFGGGLSREPDYHSSFMNLGGRVDFNQKLTTLNWSASATSSQIESSLAANTAADWGAYLDRIREVHGRSTLFGTRHDLGFSLGLSQVLDEASVLESGLTYSRSSGFMENPYKAVMLAFDDPGQFVDASGIRSVILAGVLEQRPDLRNQWAWHLRYVRHLARLDAALHASYRYHDDDWGIDAHTVEVSLDQSLGHGWTLTPGFRYYTQSAADFYAPFFFFNQAYPVDISSHTFSLDHSKLTREYFSSDARLGGFGALSAGLGLRRQLTENLKLDVSAEYYTHQAALQAGGKDSDPFTDFDSWSVIASLDIALARVPEALPDFASRASSSARNAGPQGTASAQLPAGLEDASMLERAGAFSVGYRYDLDVRDGRLRHGTAPVSDDEVIAAGCQGSRCDRAPRLLQSNIHRLDLQYAFTHWLTLSLSPRLVDLEMDLRPLVAKPATGAAALGPHPDPDGDGGSPQASLSTGSLGDTGLAALVRVFESDTQHVHAGLGFSLPSGEVDHKLNGSRRYLTYALQTGSGTLDFIPSLTWTGHWQRWSWGGQIKGTSHLESANDAGYALGDSVQATGWGGFEWLPGLFTTVRGAYTTQDSLQGVFKPHLVPKVPGFEEVQSQFDLNGDGVVDGRDKELKAVVRDEIRPNQILGPMDATGNFGGQAVALGFGLAWQVQAGPLSGNGFNLEWLQPVKEHVFGYQTERTGTLTVGWQATF